MEKKTQCELVEQYIAEHGSITSMEAIKNLGITRLSAVMFNIGKYRMYTSERIPVTNRYGDTVYVSRYAFV